MMHRVFVIAAIGSGVLWGFTVLLLIGSAFDFGFRHDRVVSVSITENFRVTVQHGCVIFFNHLEPGHE